MTTAPVPLPGALILPRNGLKIISGTRDLACQTKQKDLLGQRFISPALYVKGDTGNNITGKLSYFWLCRTTSKTAILGCHSVLTLTFHLPTKVNTE